MCKQQIFHANATYMPKLLNVHQWGKYSKIYATWELTGINHVTGSALHMTLPSMIKANQGNNAA